MIVKPLDCSAGKCVACGVEVGGSHLTCRIEFHAKRAEAAERQLAMVRDQLYGGLELEESVLIAKLSEAQRTGRFQGVPTTEAAPAFKAAVQLIRRGAEARQRAEAAEQQITDLKSALRETTD